MSTYFQDVFIKAVIIAGNTSLTIWSEDAYFIESLYIGDIKHIEDNIYKLSHITYQEESTQGSLHNVDRSLDDFAIYDVEKDVLIKDVYLFDKYNDGSDHYLSVTIEDFNGRHVMKG